MRGRFCSFKATPAKQASCVEGFFYAPISFRIFADPPITKGVSLHQHCGKTIAWLAPERGKVSCSRNRPSMSERSWTRKGPFCCKRPESVSCSSRSPLEPLPPRSFAHLETSLQRRTSTTVAHQNIILIFLHNPRVLQLIPETRRIFL